MLGDVALELAGFLVVVFMVPTMLLGAWWVIDDLIHRWRGHR